MEELDLLKKDWNKKENYPKVTEERIYAMLHKSSSSIVKWIFIISVIEILFWTGLSFFTNDEDYFKALEMYHIKEPMTVITFLNYGVVLFFIYLFYRNYKRINTTDSIKTLLKSILDTRKTVKQYVRYNLMMIFVLLLVVFSFQVKYDPNISKLIGHFGSNSMTGYAFLIGAYFIVISIILFVLWLFYKILYGFLVRRLEKNYDELKKIDM